jgi:hypothetical protein
MQPFGFGEVRCLLALLVQKSTAADTQSDLQGMQVPATPAMPKLWKPGETPRNTLGGGRAEYSSTERRSSSFRSSNLSVTFSPPSLKQVGVVGSESCREERESLDNAWLKERLAEPAESESHPRLSQHPPLESTHLPKHSEVPLLEYEKAKRDASVEMQERIRRGFPRVLARTSNISNTSEESTDPRSPTIFLHAPFFPEPCEMRNEISVHFNIRF